MNTTLIEHQTVTTVVENVEQARTDIAQAFALLQGAKERLTAVIGGRTEYASVTLFPHGSSCYNLPRLAEQCDTLQVKNAWSYLINLTGASHYMTERRRDELSRQLDKGELPELTVENVLSTLQGLSNDMGTLASEFIKEVFGWLRPHHSKHKTNKKYRVPYKVIITSALSEYSKSLNHYRTSNFRALGNALTLLDGAGVRQYPDDLPTQLEVGLKKTPYGEWFEVPYLRAKVYLNNNMHVQFLRHDLIDKLNALSADGTLTEEEA